MRGRSRDAVVVLPLLVLFVVLSFAATAEIPMRDYEHAAGFRVPVPAEWALTENETVEGFTFETVLTGPFHNGSITIIAIETDIDPTVRETSLYLRQVVDASVQGQPGSFISEEPTYRQIAGHAGAIYAITDTSEAPTIVARLAIVVSDVHDRYWLLLLRAHVEYIHLYNDTFSQMIEGFEITASPSAFGEFGAAAILALLVGVVLTVVAFLIAYYYVRKPKVQPHPYLAPIRYAPGTTPGVAIQFCPTCGRPAPLADLFCVNCGTAFPPKSTPTPESAETTPAGSETPPGPPPPP